MKSGLHRSIPLPFASDRAGMATITIPMGDSVTFKKLLRRKAWLVGQVVIAMADMILNGMERNVNPHPFHANRRSVIYYIYNIL